MRKSRITRDVTASVPSDTTGGLTLDDLRELVDAARDLPGDTVVRARVTISFSSVGSPIRSITVPAPAAAEGV